MCALCAPRVMDATTAMVVVRSSDSMQLLACKHMHQHITQLYSDSTLCDNTRHTRVIPFGF